MKHALLFITAVFLFGSVKAKHHTYVLLSPNTKNCITLTKRADGIFTYQLQVNKKQLINPSPMGFKIEDGTTIPSATNWKVDHITKQDINTVWKPVWGKRAIVPEVYNQMTVTLSSPGSAIKKLVIEVRAYNDGVAFRYLIPKSESYQVKVTSELTGFNFAGDYTAWYYNGENSNIGPEKLTDCNGTRMPVMTIKVDNANYLAVHEADLREGEPLLLHSDKSTLNFTVLSKPAALTPGYVSAWRTIVIGNSPGALIDSHLIELLNPAPAKNIDFSWVKPGVAVWDWRMNGAVVNGFTYTMSYPSWLRAVDFASKQGILYLILDADWYGPENDKDSDPLNGNKVGDVRKLIQYAKSKNVGIWLYLNDVAGKKYPIEATLKHYGDWGAAGVKYGFMNGSPEEKNVWTRKVTGLCAKNHLLVDFHDGPVHPYGQMRTWPNAVTREYCQSQSDGHKVFMPSTFVTSAFVNMIAGPIDMCNGMFDLRQGNTTRIDENQPVPSTVVSEAARTLIVFSGATVLPDIPEFYLQYPALLRFISAEKMPWKESKTLAGEIGEYIVMMRQSHNAYLIGAASNETGRTINIPLSFLPKGKFEVEITQDGKDANYLTNREVLQTKVKTVTGADNITVKLAPGGGACLLIKPVLN
ncbi:glycoside hydrolase family 97 protein [Pedobacter sp. L105]|uniref:glycoside hydrolase family 97 protein n=1 Tax=Pedobacter sp. L105 TaxID=1641871 RepID=UPI00131C3D69|nr:glycoside hydrolase family 97 protein [Pedobacter sp. L105]